jgi:hypothetical protein
MQLFVGWLGVCVDGTDEVKKTVQSIAEEGIDDLARVKI